MKEFLVIVASIALALFIGGTLILGPGASSMKTTGTTVNTQNAAHMSTMAGW